jgi:acyl-CoA synthetase (AMP-forming)/AMP-acid ligase II
MQFMNVGNWMTKWALLTPHKTALVFEGRSFSYRELNERTNRAARLLVDLGIGKGDRVGVLLHNSNEYLEVFFALSKIGALLVPLNTRFVGGKLAYILNDCGSEDYEKKAGRRLPGRRQWRQERAPL